MLKLELQFSGVDDLVTNILNQLFVPLATLLDHTVVAMVCVLFFAYAIYDLRDHFPAHRGHYPPPDYH